MIILNPLFDKPMIVFRTCICTSKSELYVRAGVHVPVSNSEGKESTPANLVESLSCLSQPAQKLEG